MKKITLLVVIMATLSGSAVHADNAGGKAARGAGANAGRTMASDAFAWGACIGTLALVGTVVGLTVSAGTSSGNFGH